MRKEWQRTGKVNWDVRLNGLVCCKENRQELGQERVEAIEYYTLRQRQQKKRRQQFVESRLVWYGSPLAVKDQDSLHQLHRLRLSKDCRERLISTVIRTSMSTWMLGSRVYARIFQFHVLGFVGGRHPSIHGIAWLFFRPEQVLVEG